MKPCWNVKQHEQAVLTRRPCEDCSGQRYFTRRGGVADRGHGSPVTTPESETESNDNDDDDDADDSGYHSDVIPEEDEPSDRDERPLSPKAIAPPPPDPRTKPCRPRKHNASSSTHRSLSRKPSWKPNLKRDLNREYEPFFSPRRDSIDSLLDAQHTPMSSSPRSSKTEDELPRLTRRMRDSTLLHPSSPPPPPPSLYEMAREAQIAQSYKFPQLVHVRRTSSSSPPVLRARKNSTLLHPSSPDQSSGSETLNSHFDYPSSSSSSENTRTPVLHTRRTSSLLHPSSSSSISSSPAPIPSSCTNTNTSSYKTILSVPPRNSNPTAPEHRHLPLRRMPPLHTTQSDPQSWTLAQTWTVAQGRRRRSVLHSCLSDDEGEEDEEFRSEEGVEVYMLRCSARVARGIRERVVV